MDFNQVNIFMPLHLKSLENEIDEFFINYNHDSVNIYIREKFRYEYEVCCENWASLKSENKIFGQIQCEGCVSQLAENYQSKSNLFRINITGDTISLKYIKIDDNEYDVSQMNIFILLYDSMDFLQSENNIPIDCSSTCNLNGKSNFEILNSIVKHKRCICCVKCDKNEKVNRKIDDKWKFLLQIFRLLHSLCSYSNLFVQIQCFIKSFLWIFQSLWKERKVSVKTGNFIISLIMDFVCGLLLLHWINQFSITPVNDLYDIIEVIVNFLRSLLQWLMGSPAGLKLNHAFNNMLGKFFLYHIGLWWMFLDIVRYFLGMALNVLQYFGILGLSFQTAILADLLSLSSFHVYCIYTYAARLYNIQIRGLIALCRLFLGRKHNPLRGGVDSYEYNHHQLFVGTLAFTILLFLFPTTFLYYVVFTIFRVILVLIGGFLTRLRYLMQTFPLYLFILWLFKSPKIAGDINITFDQHRPSSKNIIYLRITLQTTSLLNLISTHHPSPIAKPMPIEWAKLVTCLWHGDLLYPV